MIYADPPDHQVGDELVGRFYDYRVVCSARKPRFESRNLLARLAQVDRLEPRPRVVRFDDLGARVGRWHFSRHLKPG